MKPTIRLSDPRIMPPDVADDDDLNTLLAMTSRLTLGYRSDLDVWITMARRLRERNRT